MVRGSATPLYLASGTGAVPRTLQDKAGDTINAFDYMSEAQKADIRDGSMSLDTVTGVQRAIDALSGDGGEVILPAGKMLWSTKLIWPTQKHVILRGRGTTGAGTGSLQRAGTMIQFNGTGNCIEMHGTAWDSDQVGGLLRNFYLQGLGSGTASTGISVQWASGACGRLGFENVVVDRFGTGTKLDAVLEAAFFNSNMRGCGIGWHAIGAAEAVNANDWFGCGAESSSTGAKYEEGCNGNKWFGGTIEGNDIGLHLTSGTNGPSMNGLIGTWLESANAGSVAVKIDKTGGTDAVGNFLEKCWMTSWEKAIHVANGKATSIRGNRFLGFTGTKKPIQLDAGASDTFLDIDNVNDAGNNDYEDNGTNTIRPVRRNPDTGKFQGYAGGGVWTDLN